MEPALWDVVVQFTKGADHNALLAIEALPSVNRSRATDVLLQCYRNENGDPTQRRWAAYAIGYCTPSESVVDVLLAEFDWCRPSKDHQPASDLPHLPLKDCLFQLGRIYPKVLPSQQARIFQAWKAEAMADERVYLESKYFLARAAPTLVQADLSIIEHARNLFPDTEPLWLQWIALKGKPALRTIDSLILKSPNSSLGEFLLSYAFPDDPAGAIAHFRELMRKDPTLYQGVFISAFSNSFGREATAQHSQALINLIPDCTQNDIRSFQRHHLPVGVDHPMVKKAQELVDVGALPSMPDSSQIEDFRGIEFLNEGNWSQIFLHQLPKYRPAVFSSMDDPGTPASYFHAQIFNVDRRLMGFRCYIDPEFKQTRKSKPSKVVWFAHGEDSIQVLPSPIDNEVRFGNCIETINKLLERTDIQERFVPSPYFFGGYYFATPEQAERVFKILKSTPTDD